MAFLCLYPLLYSLLLRVISNGYSLLSLTVHANKWKKGCCLVFIASIPILLHVRTGKCLIFCIYSLRRPQ